MIPNENQDILVNGRYSWSQHSLEKRKIAECFQNPPLFLWFHDLDWLEPKVCSYVSPPNRWNWFLYDTNGLYIYIYQVKSEIFRDISDRKMFNGIFYMQFSTVSVKCFTPRFRRISFKIAHSLLATEWESCIVRWNKKTCGRTFNAYCTSCWNNVTFTSVNSFSDGK